MHTVAGLRQALPDMTATVVLAPSEVERWQSLCARHDFASPEIALGGATRFDSVKNALGNIPAGCDIVLVHDGARPFASSEMIGRLLQVFDEEKAYGAIPAIAVTDSLRVMRGDGGSESVDRSLFRAVQTPQAFRVDLLRDAYAKAPSDEGFTDDASVMEAAGYRNLRLVEGDSDNIKITNPHDLAIAEAILSEK